MTSIFYLHGSKLCYNLGSSSLQSLISPEGYINFPQTQTELDSSFFFNFDDDNSLSLSDTSIDSLFDTNVKDCSAAFLPNFYSTAEHSLVSLSPKKPDVNSLDEEARHPKRQKITTSENHCRFTYASELSNAAFVPNPSRRDVNIFPSSQALVFNACGNQEMKSDMKRGNSSSGSTSTTAVSVQSIAARERRRKITEKTQELGKLIPGGSKMNTAEMFQAAYKYVKFLQAQLAVLQLIPSIRVISTSLKELSSLIYSLF